MLGKSFLGVSILILAVLVNSELIQTEKDALLDLYLNSTNGAWWSKSQSWSQGDPCLNNWYGITCKDNRTVDKLDLSSNNISGTLPESLGNLTSLSSFNISSNNFDGMVPLVFYNGFNNLTTIDISRNPNLDCQLISPTVSFNYCSVAYTKCGCKISTNQFCYTISCTPLPTQMSSAPPQTVTPSPTDVPTSPPKSPISNPILNATEFLSSGQNLTFNVTSSVTVIGDVGLNKTTTLIFQGNAVIDVKGCIDLSGELILNISGLHQPQRLNPINATCFVGTGFDLVYIFGVSPCYLSASSQKVEDQSFSVLISFKNICERKFPVYAIVIVVVIGCLIIIALALVLGVTKIRRKVLPFELKARHPDL